MFDHIAHEHITKLGMHLKRILAYFYELCIGCKTCYFIYLLFCTSYHHTQLQTVAINWKNSCCLCRRILTASFAMESI